MYDYALNKTIVHEYFLEELDKDINNAFSVKKIDFIDTLISAIETYKMCKEAESDTSITADKIVTDVLEHSNNRILSAIKHILPQDYYREAYYRLSPYFSNHPQSPYSHNIEF